MGPTVDAAQSIILQTLHLLLPGIHHRLQDRTAWRGVHVREPHQAFSYQRLVCVDNIETLSPPRRTYMVGVHLFSARGTDSRLHNHRYPMAVYALDVSGKAGEMLYQMPWEHRRAGRVIASGQLRVASGHSYALEPCLEIFHAVRSLRPHVSITLADVTEPPARPNRLDVQPLSMTETQQVQAQILQAVSSGFQTIKG